MFKNSYYVGYSPMGPVSISATGAWRFRGIPWQQLQKLGNQTRVETPFWEILSSWRKAEGDHKVVSTSLHFLRATLWAPVSAPEPGNQWVSTGLQLQGQ